MISYTDVWKINIKKTNLCCTNTQCTMIQKYMKEEELQCYGGVKTPDGILPSSLTSAAQSGKESTVWKIGMLAKTVCE